MARKDSGTVKIEVQMPRATMHDIMRTAIEAGYTHGIGYWAEEDGNSVELIENESLFPVKLRFRFKDQHAMLKAGGDAATMSTEYVSTIDERDIARAMGLALGGAAAESAVQILRGDLDGPSADEIVQLAVFNELVYG